jgi:hypothetical protein
MQLTCPPPSVNLIASSSSSALSGSAIEQSTSSSSSASFIAFSSSGLSSSSLGNSLCPSPLPPLEPTGDHRSASVEQLPSTDGGLGAANVNAKEPSSTSAHSDTQPQLIVTKDTRTHDMSVGGVSGQSTKCETDVCPVHRSQAQPHSCQTLPFPHSVAFGSQPAFDATRLSTVLAGVCDDPSLLDPVLLMTEASRFPTSAFETTSSPSALILSALNRLGRSLPVLDFTHAIFIKDLISNLPTPLLSGLSTSPLPLVALNTGRLPSPPTLRQADVFSFITWISALSRYCRNYRNVPLQPLCNYVDPPLAIRMLGPSAHWPKDNTEFLTLLATLCVPFDLHRRLEVLAMCRVDLREPLSCEALLSHNENFLFLVDLLRLNPEIALRPYFASLSTTSSYLLSYFKDLRLVEERLDRRTIDPQAKLHFVMQLLIIKLQKTTDALSLLTVHGRFMGRVSDTLTRSLVSIPSTSLSLPYTTTASHNCDRRRGNPSAHRQSTPTSRDQSALVSHSAGFESTQSRTPPASHTRPRQNHMPRQANRSGNFRRASTPLTSAPAVHPNARHEGSAQPTDRREDRSARPQSRRNTSGRQRPSGRTRPSTRNGPHSQQSRAQTVRSSSLPAKPRSGPPSPPPLGELCWWQNLLLMSLQLQDGRLLLACLDSGAASSIISESFAHRHQLPITSCSPRQFQTVTGEHVLVNRHVLLSVRLSATSPLTTVPFYVIHRDFPSEYVLVGSDLIRHTVITLGDQPFITHVLDDDETSTFDPIPSPPLSPHSVPKVVHLAQSHSDEVSVSSAVPLSLHVPQPFALSPTGSLDADESSVDESSDSDSDETSDNADSTTITDDHTTISVTGSEVISRVSLSSSVPSSATSASSTPSASSISATVSLSRPRIGDALTSEQAAAVEKLTSAYSDVFGDITAEPANLPPFDIVLVPEARPFVMPVRRFTAEKEEFIQKHTEKMVALNVMARCSSRFVSAPTIARKRGGDLQFCVDYTRLNAITVPVPYPLPSISELHRSFVGQRFFAAFDLSQGFHQVSVTPRTRELLAFQTADGVFTFLRMPFGPRNAPAHFQRVMQEALVDLRGVQVYVDDVALIAATFQEFLVRLEEFFKRCRTLNVRISAKKSVIGVSELQYLGMLVSRYGVSMDPDRLAPLRELKEPRTKKELASVLGLFNYLRQYVPHYATLVSPMQALVRKTVPFVWGQAQATAFQEVKRLLLQAPVLALPVPGYPLVLGGV